MGYQNVQACYKQKEEQFKHSCNCPHVEEAGRAIELGGGLQIRQGIGYSHEKTIDQDEAIIYLGYLEFEEYEFVLELGSPNLGGHLPLRSTPRYNLPLRRREMGCDGQG
ncbi:hypothetical protein AVEN_37170-1 [Araneus ventricosus]|uniref:Uncharacterized protein n=1 Tax=Araneus ventricosus TaxID=182803 RepID=A0A4Y2UGF4_ARAVE|nr:hypothetical protein AVEN_37170-1 [Araneus ventricosus]